MKSVFPLLLFFALVGFFVLTLPANHNEAEDSYHYSRMAEQASWTHLFHAHHLLYHPLMRGVFRAAQAAGYRGRAMPVLIGVSMVCGAWAICLFLAILKRAGVDRRAVWAFAAALLFSYGFWRYSTTVEIYIPVAAVSLFSLYCALRTKGTNLFFLCGLASGALALLLHLVAIPLVLMAIPLFYFLRKEKKCAIVHFAGAVALTGAGYLVVRAFGIEPGVYRDTLAPRGTLLEPLTWIKAAVACGQTLLSGNFLFSIPRIADAIMRLFPYHMLQEELFAGQNAHPWIGGIALFTFILSLAGGMAWVFLFIRAGWAEPKRFWCAVQKPETLAALVWAGGIGGMALIHEPANPEMWISIVPALWLTIALLWSKAGPKERGAVRLPHLLALLLLIHNGIGGMAVVKSPEGDYCLHKGRWIREQAREGDVILTADSHIFVTWLQYYTPSTVLDAKFTAPDYFLRVREEAGGRVFVFDDVISLLPPVARREAGCLERIGQLGDLLRPGLTPLYEARDFRIYQYAE